ncbi:5-methylcytosine-specific restriction endonuclease system specificity protein McrC [Clostridium senegalense]|uniref:5-methylcytosine-specific restriction endonuclease system specificity protein McrC n=1 Tax=Clostridium senegalense TaxID=1465809 RepID=UPI001C10AF1D|nr:5-methylcytosine-specific restriction endonuclease system specificity protein McrC [Clostridium senegalense]MBU5227036.1 5-methylcytosine-specific restriction endonuclease system specificity protein McrC [Clostridium senegalense]
MRNDPKIPIRNIYYMLCYAWNVLEQSDDIFLGSEKFDNIYNLFARIYINGTSSLIKRGLNRYYIQEDEAVSTIKGKINISDSIKKQAFFNGRVICQYDNFSEDIKLNQIVKTTINILINSPKLETDLRNKLLKLRVYFSDIQDIRFSKAIFSTLRYNRNNNHYRMLINISQLIYQGLITNEVDNEIIFADFVRDKQMSKLYEKFVLNFFRKHLDETIYNVHAPKLKWNLDDEISEEDLSLLPEMRTDIVIENKVRNTQLIIDTKYYAQTLVSSNWTDIEKIRTGHLFQILAYVNNSKFAGDVKGMLLYPTIEKEVNVNFPIGGKSISIRTLNLDTEWKYICNILASIVD